MKSKALFGILLLAATGLVAAEYLGFTSFLTKQGGQDDVANARASFTQMSFALSKNDAAKVRGLVSATFKGMPPRPKFLAILTQKRAHYSVRGVVVKTRDNYATISYKRTETRDSDPFTTTITGELWIQDKTDATKWKLHKLADNDKWFRLLKGPQSKKKKNVAAPDLLKQARDAMGPRVMLEGERYVSKGKRDPFRSLIISDANEDDPDMEHCDAGRPRQFLESFDLLSLKLSGIIEGDGETVALIETPDGKGHTVRHDMYLGRNCGRVETITRDAIGIEEQMPKVGKEATEYTATTTELKLRPEEG